MSGDFTRAIQPVIETYSYGMRTIQQALDFFAKPPLASDKVEADPSARENQARIEKQVDLAKGLEALRIPSEGLLSTLSSRSVKTTSQPVPVVEQTTATTEVAESTAPRAGRR